MKIDGNGPVRNAPVRRKDGPRKTDGAANFAEGLKPETAPSTAGTSLGGAVAVDPLLAVQEAADATQGRAKARARGEALLDRLDELRMGLLMGFYPKERLEDLLRMVRARRPDAGSGRLAEVLDEIELRAEVELAKLGMEI